MCCEHQILLPSSAHRPRSPRQNSMGGASPGSSSLPSPQTGTAPVETVTTPTSASSPTAASPAPSIVTSSSGDGKLKFNKGFLLSMNSDMKTHVCWFL